MVRECQVSRGQGSGAEEIRSQGWFKRVDRPMSFASSRPKTGDAAREAAFPRGSAE